MSDQVSLAEAFLDPRLGANAKLAKIEGLIAWDRLAALDVKRRQAESGMTMICVTHEMGFARAVADRIVFMDDGAIVESFPPDAFFEGVCCARARQFISHIGH